MPFELPYGVTCNRCGRVSFAISKEAALRNIEQFNSMVAKQPAGGPYEGARSDLSRYRCIGCGNNKEFRKAVPGDAPAGVTVNPVIVNEALYQEVREDYEKQVLTAFSKLELDTNIVMERLEVTHEGIVELLRKYGIEYPRGVVSDAFHRELMERELLASFSRGEISKSTVMDRLDVSYSEVLDLLERFRLPLP